MGQLTNQTWRTWHDGVVTTVAEDEVGPSASPRGRNSALLRVGPGTAQLRTRRGCTTINATPITSSPAIHGQLEFKSYDGAGSYTTYHLLISNLGRLDYKDSSTTTAAFDGGSATPFSSGDYRPDSAVAANAAYICNGQASNNKKAYINGGSRKVHGWGITRPTVGTLAGAAGAAGGPNGTYELRVSYGNSVIGAESSISDTATATVVVANQKISVTNVPTSADAQVDTRYIYVRNTATMTNFYRAGTIANNSGTTITLDFTDASLVTIGPDTNENDPPPTLSVCEWHVSRMFGVGPTAPTTLLYSKLGKPEAFDPDNYELVNPIDGQSITALRSTNGVLLILKRESAWILIGDDPASWELRLLSATIGCTAAQSVVHANGRTYWWSELGMASWDGTSGKIDLFSQELIGPSSDEGALTYASLSNICAAADVTNRRIMFAVPSLGQTRNDHIIPYSYALERFEAEYWDPLDVSSFGVVDDSASNPVVYVGGYSGQLFQWWNGNSDGVPSGTDHGAVTSTTNTTLTCSTATFLTTGGGLVARYVYAIDATGRNVQRRRISSNTGTVLTIDTAWETNPNSTYTFVVGGVDFQWDTNITDFGGPFSNKRLRFLYIQSSGSDDATVYADILVDGSTTPALTRGFVLIASSGPGYGVGLYGIAHYGASLVLSSGRTRTAQMCKNARVRVRILHQNIEVTLQKLALTAELLTDDLGSGDSGTVIT